VATVGTGPERNPPEWPQTARSAAQTRRARGDPQSRGTDSLGSPEGLLPGTDSGSLVQVWTC
jgi:hypothetical protein